jgi:hypothetical protein
MPLYRFRFPYLAPYTVLVLFSLFWFSTPDPGLVPLILIWCTISWFGAPYSYLVHHIASVPLILTWCTTSWFSAPYPELVHHILV